MQPQQQLLSYLLGFTTLSLGVIVDTSQSVIAKIIPNSTLSSESDTINHIALEDIINGRAARSSNLLSVQSGALSSSAHHGENFVTITLMMMQLFGFFPKKNTRGVVMFSNLINSQKSIQKIVDKSLRLVFDLLDQFSDDPLFNNKIAIAFGDGANVSAFKTAWSKRNFSEFPPIEIRRASEINGANGAFAIATDKIYLSQEFITANANNLSAIASVLLC
jgi:hypothetical protein